MFYLPRTNYSWFPSINLLILTWRSLTGRYRWLGTMSAMHNFVIQTHLWLLVLKLSLLWSVSSFHVCLGIRLLESAFGLPCLGLWNFFTYNYLGHSLRFPSWTLIFWGLEPWMPWTGSLKSLTSEPKIFLLQNKINDIRTCEEWKGRLNFLTPRMSFDSGEENKSKGSLFLQGIHTLFPSLKSNSEVILEWVGNLNYFQYFFKY